MLLTPVVAPQHLAHFRHTGVPLLPVPTSIRLPRRLKQWLERQALAENSTVSRIIVREIAAYMKRRVRRTKEPVEPPA